MFQPRVFEFLTNAAPFILDVDYSNVYKTIGCILSQEQPCGSGQECGIIYKSNYYANNNIIIHCTKVKHSSSFISSKK